MVRRGFAALTYYFLRFGRGNSAQSCLLKASFTWTDGFLGLVPVVARSQLHSEHPQAAKVLFSRQIRSLAIGEDFRTGRSRLLLNLVEADRAGDGACATYFTV